MSLPNQPLTGIQDAVFCLCETGQVPLRTSKRGANAGYQFLGCSTYPACRGTRQYLTPNT